MSEQDSLKEERPQPKAGPERPRSNLVVRCAKRLYWRADWYWRVWKPVVDLAGGIRGTVLLAGTARSGTTWVGNVITAMMGARGLFEPMLLDQDMQWALLQSRYLTEPRLRRNYQLYVPEGEGRNSKHFEPVNRILRGKVTGPWCHSVTRAGVYMSRVVKEVRANLMLGWLAATWPELRIIWLVRDPVAVIESQIIAAGIGWQIGWSPDCVLDQPQVVTDWLAPYVEAIKQAREPWELLAHKWCIENFIPLRQQLLLKHPNLMMVRYEELQKGWDAWKPVTRHLKSKPWNREAFEAVSAEPSLTAIAEAKEPGRGERQTKLDGKAQESIQRIVETYDLASFLAGTRPQAPTDAAAP